MCCFLHNYDTFTYTLLRCCETIPKTLALSCFQDSEPDASIGDYCPSPPVLSLSDAYSSSISGPLDTDNTFVAEYLIGEADRLKPSVFFQDVQAGFVVSYLEPSLSFCKQPEEEETQKFSALLNIFYNRSAFDFPNPDCDFYLDECWESLSQFGYYYCKKAMDLSGCVESALPNITDLPADYYNSLPYDLQYLIQYPACDVYSENPSESPSVAKVFPDQESSVTVTIWYNNQV